MQEALVTTLTDYPILTLFVVIGLGYVVGQIPIFGVRLGVAGVLFAGLAVGSLGPSVALPDALATLGLIMFVYTVGIHSGPAFFNSIRGHGFRATVLAVGSVVLGAVLTVALAAWLGIGGPRAAGLFCGAMTNTPALEATREVLRDTARSRRLAPQQTRALMAEPVIAYSLSYPMGVVGVMLVFQFTRRLWRAQPTPPEQQPEILVRDFVVRNPGVAGCTVGDLLRVHKQHGFVISRIRKEGRVDIPRFSTRLELGDIVAVVGGEEAIERAQQIFGEPAGTEITADRSELDIRRVIVSNKEVVGKRIRDLELQDRLSATITRLMRGDIDVVPTPETRLESGDRVLVLTRRSNFAAVSQFFGDSIKGTAETEFISVALGMVLGVMAGLMPIPLPGGSTVKLGLAGGPLLVALVLGRVERTGRMTWVMPVSANLTLRQIGLLLFLAGVGTRAGHGFAATVRDGGLVLIGAGALVTMVPAAAAMYAGYKLMRLPFDTMTGLVSGVQTQSACLAFANNQTASELPNVAYASVYATSMVIKIVLAQLMVAWLGAG